MFGMRLTPAYAGNIGQESLPTAFVEAHPRIRGEYYCLNGLNGNVTGSPPHTRGIFLGASKKADSTRLTPAYAGNIVIAWMPIPPYRAHPRIRGEYVRKLCESCKLSGSPPHTRGIYFLLAASFASVRLTPAYAGNIYPELPVRSTCAAHPRIRGEYR